MNPKNEKIITRRNMLEFCAVAALGGVSVRAFADGHNKVPLDDPQAVALAYVEDASNVDTGKFPKYKEGKKCGNCLLFQGKADAAHGPCPIFGGKEVAQTGWCNAHTPKS